MAVFCENNNFYLTTNDTAYVITVCEGIPVHLYYGEKIPKDDLTHLIDRQLYDYCPSVKIADYRRGSATLEFSGANTGDYRPCGINVKNSKGFFGCRLSYVNYRIIKGCAKINGLPYSRGKNCDTLCLILRDSEKQITVKLYYGVFEKSNVIARHTEIINEGENVVLTKAASSSLDFVKELKDRDLIQYSGSVNAEFTKIERKRLLAGDYSSASRAGFTTHAVNPFFAICDSNATEDYGEAYGFNLLYSGNFLNEIEVDFSGGIRVVSGINPETFEWTLHKGSSFVTPQAILTYSAKGLNKLSQNFHNHIREHVVPAAFKKAVRPIVLNTWEFSGVEVSEALIEECADKAKEFGIDTVVLDDGWFREDLSSGLGDWKVDKSRFPGGLASVAEKVRKRGLGFGIWIEPEMISVNSDLITNHPEYLMENGNEKFLWRDQYVLDLANPEVVEYLKGVFAEVLDDVNPDYVKWDANRYLSEVGSRAVKRQGEVFHRYMLGVYELCDFLTSRYPNALFESCSGGGGRFDLGMLFYTSQIWLSDMTDPSKRALMQYNASLAYPPSVMSCHVSAAGNYSLAYRYLVSSFGVYGYECDLSKFSENDRLAVLDMNREYKEIADMIITGDFYRIIRNEYYEAYMHVAKDKSTAVLTFLSLKKEAGIEQAYIRLKGLEPAAEYENSANDCVFSGKTLTSAGILISDLNCSHITNQGIDLFFNQYRGSNDGVQIVFRKIEE